MASGSRSAAYQGGYKRACWIPQWPGHGSAVAPNPPSSGLKIWLEPSVGGVATSGSNVTSLTDQASGIVFPSAGADSPALITGASGLNGYSGVRFTNTGGTTPQTCYLSASINPSTWTGITVLYVIRTVSSGAVPIYNSVFGWGQSASSWWALNAGYGGDANQAAGWAGLGGTVNLGNFSPPIGISGFSEVIDQSYQYDKASWTLSGRATGTGIVDTSFPTGAVTALVGSNTYGGSQSNSDLFALLVYDHKLNATDLAAAKAYLNARYGAF